MANIYLSPALCATVWNTHTKSPLSHSHTQRLLVQSSSSSQCTEEKRGKHGKSLSSSVWASPPLSRTWWRCRKGEVGRREHEQTGSCRGATPAAAERLRGDGAAVCRGRGAHQWAETSEASASDPVSHTSGKRATTSVSAPPTAWALCAPPPDGRWRSPSSDRTHPLTSGVPVLRSKVREEGWPWLFLPKAPQTCRRPSLGCLFFCLFVFLE